MTGVQTCALPICAIKVAWIKSGSVDVKSYDLYRKTIRDTHWSRIKVISTCTGDSCHFIDDKPPIDIELFYTVVAVDDAQLESLHASPVKIKFEINNGCETESNKKPNKSFHFLFN